MKLEENNDVYKRANMTGGNVSEFTGLGHSVLYNSLLNVLLFYKRTRKNSSPQGIQPPLWLHKPP